MVNVLKLKSKMLERGINGKQLSERLGMHQSTFYRRLHAAGETFTVKDVTEIVRALDLNSKEASEIFFGNNSHIREIQDTRKDD